MELILLGICILVVIVLFYSQWQKSGKAALVLFYNKNCGPCKMMLPEWEKLKYNTIKYEISEYPALFENFDIKTTPTIYFLTSKGARVKYEGGRTVEDWKKFIDNIPSGLL